MKIFSRSLLFMSLTIGLLYGCEDKIELNPPRNIRISNQQLLWDVNVINALPDFLVTVNNGEPIRVTYDTFGLGVNRLNLNFITENGEYTFRIQSVTNGITEAAYKNSIVVEETFSITILSAVSFVSYNLQSETVEWNQSSGSKGYEIVIDGQSYSTSDNFFPLSRKEAGGYVIRVRAIGDNGTLFSSTFSTNLVITFLSRPVNLSRSGLTITWSPVNNASSYRIYNQLTQIGETINNSYVLSNFLTGNLSITVAAIGNNTTFFDSLMSDPLQFTLL